MAFEDFFHKWSMSTRYPKTVSHRFMRLCMLQKLIDGKLYEINPWPFEKEFDNSGKYIEMVQRRPSLQFNLAKIIVDQSTSLCFSESYAPSVRVFNEESDNIESEKVKLTHKTLERIIEEVDLDAVMLDAARKGAIGSVALVLRCLSDGRPYIETISGQYCVPQFDLADPTKLVKLTQVYDTSAEELRLKGYDGEYDDSIQYWMQIIYTPNAELHFYPLPRNKFERLGKKETNGTVIDWVLDTSRSLKNPLNEINVVWIRNLEERTNIDGVSTYADIADDQIRISYLMSMVDRGLVYTADPLMEITRGELGNILPEFGFESPKKNSEKSSDYNHSPAKAIVLENGASAKYLEISGEGLRAAIEYIKLLREYALEKVGGMKADQQHEKGAHSGKALRMLHQTLFWLSGRLKTSYGKHGYVPILRMILRGFVDGVFDLDDIDVTHIYPNAPMRLVWPDTDKPDGNDLLNYVQAVETAVGGSMKLPVQVLPRRAATQLVASVFGLSDTNRIVAELEGELTEAPITASDVARNDIEHSQKDVTNVRGTDSGTDPGT